MESGPIDYYDDNGDTRQGMTEAERTAHNTWSAVAIIPSAPFAMAQLLPPELWKAISVMLGRQNESAKMDSYLPRFVADGVPYNDSGCYQPG